VYLILEVKEKEDQQKCSSIQQQRHPATSNNQQRETSDRFYNRDKNPETPTTINGQKQRESFQI